MMTSEANNGALTTLQRPFKPVTSPAQDAAAAQAQAAHGSAAAAAS